MSTGHQDLSAQSMVEYMLIMLLIAIVLILVVTMFGASISSMFSQVISAFPP